MALRDIGTPDSTDEKGKIIKGKGGPAVVLSNEVIPELDDYNTGDELELMVKAKITKIARPQQEENVSKSVEPAEFTIELVAAEIMNLSEDRKKAERMGLGMKEYKEVQGKRGGGMLPAE